MTCPVCGEIVTEDENDTSCASDAPNVICRYCRYMEIVDLDVGDHDAGEDD